MEYDIGIIVRSDQTCLICPDHVTGKTKAFTSQCKLRKGHDGKRNYDDVHRIVCSAILLDTTGFFNKICLFRLAILIS